MLNYYVQKEYQILLNKLILISQIILLSACSATQPPPYQKNREPEDRDQYSGTEGMVQYQKDQSYLMHKELEDKCTSAKIDFAIAESDKNVKEVLNQKKLINSTCI